LSNKNLYLIPVPIGSDELFLSEEIQSAISNSEIFFVENVRSARRFLSGKTKRTIQDTLVLPFDKRSKIADIQPEVDQNWVNAAYLSEAGLPCIADPGNLLVQYAHAKNWKVNPVTGPSSIFLTLMASGLNGQDFAFKGYIPKKNQNQFQKEVFRSVSGGQTILFMDTPYRSQDAFQYVLDNFPGHLKLCVGSDLHNKDQMIVTKPLDDWKKSRINLKGKPVMFALGQ
jgi:16S rRNA (cytidine1402-2'-O)-methyltransferase